MSTLRVRTSTERTRCRRGNVSVGAPRRVARAHGTAPPARTVGVAQGGLAPDQVVELVDDRLEEALGAAQLELDGLEVRCPGGLLLIDGFVPGPDLERDRAGVRHVRRNSCARASKAGRPKDAPPRPRSEGRAGAHAA